MKRFCQYGEAARRRSLSALPRETYYSRSRWSLAEEASHNLLNVESPSDLLVRGRLHPSKIFSRKESKEMEGGNEATIGSGITQFDDVEPKV